MEDFDTKVVERVSARTTDFLRDQLRAEFPYMKTEVVESAVVKTLRKLSDVIENDKPNMAATKARISFLSLPAEIRNNIYEMILFEPPGLRHPVYLEHVGCIGTISPGLDHLLHTSRQVRHESSSIYFSDEMFGIDMDDGQLPCNKATKWLEMIGPKQASKIKRLVLNFYADSAWYIQVQTERLSPAGSVRRPHLMRPGASIEITKEEVLRSYKLSGLGLKLAAVVIEYGTGGRKDQKVLDLDV